jgi:MEDS: MEthanogen/methylotroph, DcmR Sensory domain
MDPADNKVNLRGKFPEERNRPIRLGGSVLGPPRHICAFFNSHDDEYRVLLPFIKDGFECGEKAVHTVEPKRVDEHIERLATAGVDLAAARRSRQFALRSWADANLRNQASV